MKKIFIIVSSVIMVGVITLLIVLSNIRTNSNIEHEKPASIYVYNKTNNPTIIKEDNENYAKIMNGLENMTNMSLFDRLIKLKTLDTSHHLSKDGTYAKWTTELSMGNYVIELVYNDEQDVVVYDGEHTRVISYFCVYYVFSARSDFSDIAVYYSSTNDSTLKQDKYASCEPIILNGYTKDIVSLIKKVK